jgi:two-component system, OmpR family, sensor histidine kinase KdpD
MILDLAQRRSRRARWAWPVSFLVLGVVAVGLLSVRAHLDKAHVALAFLLVVLAGSAVGGRLLGISLSAVAFLVFDFVFLPPYYTLAIENPLDWLVLGAFLVTGVIAAQLLAWADERTETARQRAIEVERLAVLGAETLNAGRAEEALSAIARVIQSTLGVTCCEIFIENTVAPTYTRAASAGACGDLGEADAASLAAWVARAGAPAAERADRTAQVAPAVSGGAQHAPTPWRPDRWTAEGDVRALFVPLLVRDRTVGVLRIANEAPIVLDPAQRQFLDALAYYAALGAERVRLVAEAERAEAFRQAGRLKDALIAAVSHDLRTPLTTIKALAHTLAARGQSEAGSIEAEADRLNRMVADLLDLSRLNAGALPLRLELNVADELVGAALRSVDGVRGDRSVVVRMEGGELLGASCDTVQSVRVLVNLLENALKYSPASSPVELTVRRLGDRLEFAVADRGPGIPEAERERVFTPFYRPPNTVPDVGGAGLGLAIARGMADAQGGHVRVEPRPGGGSVFVFDVPAAEVPVLEPLDAP